MVRKWPAVKTGPGPRALSVGEAMDLPALKLATYKFDWSKLKRLCPMVSDTGRGVVMVEFDQGIVVIKSSVEGSLHMFANKLANLIGVKNPETRVMEAGSPEHQQLESTLYDIFEKDDFLSMRIGTYLSNTHVLVQEAATRTLSLKGLEGHTLAPFILQNENVLYAIGKVMATDVLMANSDRFPIQGLYQNGNPENILFEMPPIFGTVAIDLICRAPQDLELRDTMCSHIKELVKDHKSLREGLVSTRTFIKKESGVDIGEIGIETLARGFQSQLRTLCKVLNREVLETLKTTVSTMVPPDTMGHWTHQLELISIDFLVDVLGIFTESSLNAQDKIAVKRTRIVGPRGMAEHAATITGDARTMVFYDFDRTLTNGLASPDIKELKRRIRGGEDSLAALRDLSEKASLYVVTARSPRSAVVDQLATSLRGPQKELGEFFLKENTAEGPLDDTSDIKFCGFPLAYSPSTHLYASGYEKPAAVAHALQLNIPKGFDYDVSVVFYDDVVLNVHDVGTRLAEILIDAGRDDLASERVKLECVWWDTYEEEIGENATMAAAPTKNPEYINVPMMYPHLAAFGLEQAEVEKRHEAYLKLEQSKNNGKGLSEAAPKPPPGKLKLKTGQQDLAAFLFGGGKKRFSLSKKTEN
mmetsp:Transcript_21456/g.39996  ORF Transcript_21456/g.39996 Transcript_21456/m.39996 type:complete len:643 (+) Transcript_21456:101-2029(+)|eukprot:CAMPEP_0184511876 /NCGR_PEP_ID=MMETSP0198_2-20121128/2582_1 /TAXON_ID=1112570 /ORGANISM="Thraustochytrium sp., Strain LLF1b" /LENGTH=642 /DNA_ID=CAMNT_0026901865 /DNA_START=67 /DNA_END=1995 /DNA_ORIENTATION=+